MKEIQHKNFPDPFYYEGIPNLLVVNGYGTKSFVEITSRMLPTEEHPRYGNPKPELWVEAKRGQELFWQTMALATFGAIQLAIEHPDRLVQITKYGYRSPLVTV